MVRWLLGDGRSGGGFKGDTSPPRLTAAELDRVLDDLQALKHQNPAAFQRIAARLRDVISD